MSVITSPQTPPSETPGHHVRRPWSLAVLFVLICACLIVGTWGFFT
jgi:hypothetical protein